MTPSIPPHAGQPVLSQGASLDWAKVAVIMVHGRGASAQDILGLAEAIPHPAAAYLAPQAVGGTWYPMSFMAPIEANEPGISSGIGVIHGLIDDLVGGGVPTERIVLLGFSQGACLASTAAQRRPARYGGVIAYSGGLIGPPGTAWGAEGSFGGTPMLFGCSDRDPHIPETRVRESADHLARMGAEVTLRIYEGMGHLVNADEIRFARDLLAEVAAG